MGKGFANLLAWLGSDWRLPIAVLGAFCAAAFSGWAVGEAFDLWDFEVQLQSKPGITQVLPGKDEPQD